MKTNMIAGQLRRCPLLKRFEVGELEKLALMVEVRKRDPNARLYTAGEIGESMFIIIQGEVRLSIEVDGAPRVISRLGPVETFGELGVIAPCPRMMTAEAVEEVTLLELTFGTLSMLETSDPKLALLLLSPLRRHLCERLVSCQPLLQGTFVKLLRGSTT